MKLNIGKLFRRVLQKSKQKRESLIPLKIFVNMLMVLIHTVILTLTGMIYSMWVQVL